MRTSAEKNSPLRARIEKEISLAVDLAPCAQNFAPIVRSRESALKAIARDRNFSRRAAILSRGDPCKQIFLRERKKYFRSRQTP
jgi:precorrin-6B methylase 1